MWTTEVALFLDSKFDKLYRKKLQTLQPNGRSIIQRAVKILAEKITDNVTMFTGHPDT